MSQPPARSPQEDEERPSPLRKRGGRAARRPRRRAALRFTIGAAVLLPVLALLAVWVATRSWFIILVAAPRLEKNLGGEVRIGDARWAGGGRIVFKDLILRSRKHEGHAAQALRIGEAEVSFEPLSVLSGLTITEVNLDGVLLRLSEDRRTPGSFNFAGLSPDWTPRPAARPMLPPAVRIRSAVIEVGMHVGGEYELVGKRQFAGALFPAPGGAGWFQFRLQEIDSAFAPLGAGGISIEGRWNPQTMEHVAHMTGLVLDDRTYGMCPQVARLWWQRMAPRGPVGSAEFHWTKGEPFSAVLNVDRMELTLPIAATDLSATYQPGKVEDVTGLPRMYVHSGTIRLVGDQLTLDNLVGTFGMTSGQEDLIKEYRVNFSMDDLPTFDWEHPQEWMERVVDTSPFRMTLRMDNFRVEQKEGEAPRAVELPRPIAETLSKFNLTGWSLTTQVEVSRESPAEGPDGPVAAPIRSVGKALIENASGAFQGFPYPLDDVTADVQFDNERVKINYVTARGSDNATLWMSGEIAPPDRDAAITLSLTARNVPLDDRFRKALSGGQLTTYDVMLHKPSFEALKAEGLLPGPAEIAAAIEERRARAAELAALPEGAEDAVRKRLEREIAGLDALIDAGPFDLGGLVDLDLRIVRPRGTGTGVEITGMIDVHHAGVVYGRFPYPIYVLGGKLRLDRDRVVVLETPGHKGFPVVTPGGGRGEVAGEVRLVHAPEGTRVEPALTFELMGDKLSELLFAAMPLTEQDKQDDNVAALRPVPRRSLIARVLAGAGITGWLNHAGVISADEEGRPSFDFAVELVDARAEPNRELFETMQELGLPSPTGLSLDSVHALVQITPESVRLVDFTGRRGEAQISADASLNLAVQPVETELEVRFDDMAVERYMVDLTSGAAREQAAELWERYQPQGVYDAKLHYRTRGDHADHAELVIWPDELRGTVNGEPVALTFDRGRVEVQARKLLFHDLAMSVRSGGREDGQVSLDGTWELTGEKAMNLRGGWQDGEFACPLIMEALRLARTGAQAARYADHAPQGTFDASFSFASAQGGRPLGYRFALRPDTLGLTLKGTAINARLEPGSELELSPGRLVLRDVHGSMDGAAFRADGAIDLSGPLDADVDLSYEGPLDSPQLRVLLPEAVLAPLEAMEMRSNDPIRLEGGRLRLTRVPGAAEPGEWATQFTGRLRTEGASLRAAGVQFEGVTGAFDVTARSDPESGTNIDLAIQGASAAVQGRQLTGAFAQVSFAGKSRHVNVPDFVASAYGGVITGSASVGLDPESEYTATIDLGGVGFSGIASPAGLRPGPHGWTTPPGGQVYGAFSLRGQRDHPETRRGRGAIRVAYGRMADMPLTLRVLQVAQLMPPLSGSLDFADVEFYINADRMVFQRLFLECPTLQLIGEGSMTVPGMELDLRVRTRGTMPLVSAIVAAVSDSLFEVEITGPLADPKARLVALPGIGRVESAAAPAQARGP
jgi:hypothetical protein